MGNKIDLSTKDVSTELGTVFARRKKLMFQEVSAKDNINIENSFYKLIEMLIESRSID
jgi:GTPase SAR1 family protein